MSQLIGRYKNGNYFVSIYEDGTKVRYTPEDAFIAEFPESIDLKITSRCFEGCPACHENSTPDGDHADILHLPFVRTLRPYTEVAIGGGDPLLHPDLMHFLAMLRDKNVLPNLTVSASSFLDYQTTLRYLTDNKLIFGLGISVTTPASEDFIQLVKQFPNAVIHVIAGLTSPAMLDSLSGHGLKILFLGYKKLRRGQSLYTKMHDSIDANITHMRENLEEITKGFTHVSFDNLAIRQLGIKEKISPAQWEAFYMGDDGQHTMYIDAVKGQFAVSSTMPERLPLKTDIKDMFEDVKRLATAKPMPKNDTTEGT